MADPDGARLAAITRRESLAADPGWARLAANQKWTRMVTDILWTSMAVNPCSIFLVDNGRVLQHAGRNQQVHGHSKLIFPANFNLSSHPSVPKLTRLFNVSGVPGVKIPGSYDLCITTTSFSSKHGDHSCYEGICSFCTSSTGTKSSCFWRSELCVPKLGCSSLTNSESTGWHARPRIQGFLGLSSPLLA